MRKNKKMIDRLILKICTTNENGLVYIRFTRPFDLINRGENQKILQPPINPQTGYHL
jgi:hypothetical protein